jgi:hypothetical protein
MKKKAFRAQPVARPGYPMLGELDAGALRKWGLVAVGGLLLGGAACKQPPPGEPPLTRKEEVAAQKAAHAPAVQALDAGAPPAQYIGPPGEPPLDRNRQTGKAPAQGTEADRGWAAAATARGAEGSPEVGLGTPKGRGFAPQPDP